MFIYKKLVKITGSIKFVIILIFFSTLEAKNLDKFNKADKISGYFSGVVLLNQSKYEDSYKYLRKLEGLEKNHTTFSNKYLFTLVNSENFTQAFNFSKRLEKEKKDIFESDLVIGIYYLKNSNFDLSKKYFLKAKQRKSKSLLDRFLIESLHNWSNLKNIELENAELNLSELDNRFENLKKIQNIFLNCFYGSDKTENSFNNLISNKQTDFSRYNYFHANYLDSIGKNNKAKQIIEISLKKSPRNLLLNQYKIDLQTSEKNFDFDCQKEKHVMAELASEINQMNDLTDWWNKIEDWKNECPLTFESNDGRLRSEHIITKLSELTNGNAVVVTDVGQHQMWTAQYYKYTHPRSNLTSGGLGTMGFSVPAAIGASFGVKDRPVVSLNGDGGFQMNIQELITAAYYKLPIKFIILNNSFLGMVRQWQELFHAEKFSFTDLSHSNPDFKKVGEAFGLKSFSTDNPKDVESILKEMLEYNEGPTLAEFKVVKEDMVFPIIPSGASINEMITKRLDPKEMM